LYAGRYASLGAGLALPSTNFVRALEGFFLGIAMVQMGIWPIAEQFSIAKSMVCRLSCHTHAPCLIV